MRPPVPRALERVRQPDRVTRHPATTLRHGQPLTPQIGAPSCSVLLLHRSVQSRASETKDQGTYRTAPIRPNERSTDGPRRPAAAAGVRASVASVAAGGQADNVGGSRRLSTPRAASRPNCGSHCRYHRLFVKVPVDSTPRGRSAGRECLAAHPGRGRLPLCRATVRQSGTRQASAGRSRPVSRAPPSRRPHMS
jgi:hypothetical protein